ncbi:MAG TPA: ACT domain-containing protein [Acidimicrobiia bacterium]|nr:ACT domain-containing protein [Acidimicrobiia bacterium]
MSEEQTPSDGSPEGDPLQPFLSARRTFLEHGAAGIPPWDIGGHLTVALDAALRDLAKNQPEVAVVAVGGYGRGDLCLYSDIDLLLVHNGPAPEEAVRAILYPLWDAGLKVGHATRTVKATVSVARDDLTVLCNLLTLRQVGGPAELVADLQAGLIKLLGSARSNLPELLAAEERQIWDREPFPVQDLDVKIGRGGLRSLHRLEWDRRRSALLGEEPVLPVEGSEAPARQTLLAVRQALHAIQRRAADRYVIDLRPRVGMWLDRDPLELASEVYRSARSVDAVAALRWGRVRPAGSDPIAHAGLAVARFVRSRWSRGELAATPIVFARSAAASSAGGRLSPWERDFAARSGAPEWSAGDRAGFVSLLASGLPGWEALLGLWEAGWLGRALPEVGHLRGLAQAAPFHHHPVDAHLGATVAEVVALAEGSGWCGEVADEIGSLDEVLLSAFLHDVGKGLGGDHSVIGAGLAISLLRRTGFGEASTELVGSAVRHHLILPDTAFRRDLDDPAVVTGVASTVGNLDLLKVLALLSVADARATGPDMWSPWKESLLRNLFSKVSDLLTGTASELPDELRQAVLAMVPDVGADVLTSHLAGMPPGYLARFGPELVAHHVRLVHRPLVDSEVRTAVLPGAPMSTLVTVARDRPRLLATITGALSLHNLTVLEARVATRADGIALDSFRVEDALGSDMIGQGRWPGVRETLVKALAGEIDLQGRLAEKRAAYRITGESRPAQASIHRRPGGFTIDVTARDRVGLLHDLAVALADLGLEVDLAKINTRGREAVDVFEVRDPLGLAEAEVQRALETALESGA